MKTFYIVSYGEYDGYRVHAILESEQDAREFISYYPDARWNKIEPMLDGKVVLDLYRQGLWCYNIVVKLADGEILTDYKYLEPVLDPITKYKTDTWKSIVVGGCAVVVPPYDIVDCYIWASDHAAAIQTAQKMRWEELAKREKR